MDGIISYLTWCWLMDKNPLQIKHVATSIPDLSKKLKSFYQNEKVSDYYIWFLDLNVQDLIDQNLINHPNITVVDHHEYEEDILTRSSKTKFHLDSDYSSCCLQLYHSRNIIFKRPQALTKEQKHLIILGDDYDSWTLKFKDSYKLNIVYTNMTPRVPNFIQSFGEGFYGFSQMHKNLISHYLDRYKKQLKNCEFFYKKSGNYTFISTISNEFVNELGYYILDKLKADIAIILIPEANRISFRSKESCPIDLSKFVSELSDDKFSGGGHFHAAGMKISEKFLKWSKTFELLSPPS